MNPTLPVRIQETVQAIRSRTGFKPQIGVILGTGLGSFAQSMQVESEIPYESSPHFARVTAEGHAGKLVLGTLGGKSAAALQGRFHYYEGYSLDQITFPVRLLKALGCETLLVTNIAGGMNPQFKTGDLMVITDHINLMGVNPLVGPNYEELGPRFPDMSQPYARDFVELAAACALDLKIPLHRGVYSAMTGPCLETAAEYRMLRILGADAIGMSTVPEVIAAVHAGLKVLGLSLISDLCLPDALKPVSLPELFAVVAEAEPKMAGLVKEVIGRMPA
jgi:purine-nucleoside phosphorylase